MAYIALYRKWRPKSFEDVVGQGHITETLQKAIDTDKVAHAYLFSGPRGTGKTSTAKIFARAMNCLHGPIAHPCNECEVCRHILQGESLDVVEIDAASNRSIEDIRTLRETIKFMPVEGHKKIYIIDEVHMLTTEAFNALLKTLEEPPAHVIFILATTEPERIPMTILSRCQRYEFRRITSQDIAERLRYVAAQEQIKLTKGAAHILAVQADGGMRDALSMLDQCVSNAAGTIDEALVRELLGLIGREWLFSLCNALFDRKGDVIIKAVDDVVHMGKEPQVILTEVVEHLRAIMLYQADAKTDTLAAYADSMKELAAQAKRLTPERVFSILNVLQQALLSAKNSPVPRVAVEMGLLMAARGGTSSASEAAVDDGVVASILERLTQLESRISQGTHVKAKESKEYIPLPDDEIAAAVPQEFVPFPEEEYAAPSQVQQAMTQPAAPAMTVAAEDETNAAEPIPEQGQRQETAPMRAIAKEEYQKIWKAMCAILDRDKKKAVLSCIQNGIVIYMGEGEAIVSYKTPFMVKRANREDYYTYVDNALASIIGSPIHMKGYLAGAPELAAYEKKNSNIGIVSEPAAPMEEKSTSSEPNEKAAVAAESKVVEATIADMTQEERDVLEPLLKAVGDCNIYIEQKN